ncbi:S49 family peptidase [Halorhodospira neutriphila]|uniref:S49 family peptidase n=1 Tax=Halorhodospira neutriphila TaxID=168379 RepID=A0ABS1E5G3_9GAMM|nr:S49 family peptidase [Halorhodospira neutriphila]MBK1726422.1 S49 family peptidase [Halorhodospira neutriphila]
MSEETWEQKALREIHADWVRERRRARRWQIVWRSLLLLLVAAAILSLGRCQLGGTAQEDIGPHTAEVRLEGPIMADSPASAGQVIDGLEAAFEAEQAAGVVLRINSPGGSAVHSSQIYDAIQRLREENPDTPLYAVIEDVGASGAYYAAAAADRIYVDEASIVGSIGVIMGGFGLEDALERLGIERRLYTAGENKDFLDPFSPERPEQVEHLQSMLGEIHEQFIADVRAGRDGHLVNPQENELFSGLVWTGSQSVELGLADGVGSVRSVAREVVGEEQVVDYTVQRDLLGRLSERLGTALGQGLFSTLQRLEYQPR